MTEIKGKSKPVVEWNREAFLLEYPFPPEQISKLDKAGGLDYIEGAVVIQRLNDVFGSRNWSFQIIEQTETDTEVVVKGRLTIHGEEHDTIKEQFGRREVVRGREGRQAQSIGDVMKGAGTDCLRKCASLLGVGLHLHSDNLRLAFSYRYTEAGSTDSLHLVVNPSNRESPAIEKLPDLESLAPAKTPDEVNLPEPYRAEVTEVKAVSEVEKVDDQPRSRLKPSKVLDPPELSGESAHPQSVKKSFADSMFEQYKRVGLAKFYAYIESYGYDIYPGEEDEDIRFSYVVDSIEEREHQVHIFKGLGQIPDKE